MKLRLLLLYFGVFLAISSFANSAPNFTISGTISDAKNGETLIGATVAIKNTSTGTAANSYGFYSLSLAPGEYLLTYSFIGYESITRKVNLNKDIVLNVELVSSSTVLSSVVVSASAPDEQLRTVEMGVEKLQAKTIKKIPALMGEVDVIKAIQLLPGVQSTSEGGSGFSVRGGTPDQNLILLDEATVYNASHLLGFFSVFNNDAVKDIQLYKGDVPAKYGGRLSSLLDVRMKDGNAKKFSGAGGIGTISSRLTLEAPIVKDRTTLLVSGRRTYMDIFLGLSKDETLKDTKLYFYDLNTKFSHKINENNRIYISNYLGHDEFGASIFGMGFGNKTFTARWNHTFNPKLFMNITGVWSNYDYKLAIDEESLAFAWESELEDWGAKVDFSYYLNSLNTLEFGAQSFVHKFSPGGVRATSPNSAVNDLILSNNFAYEHAAYISHEFTLKNLTVKYGLRGSIFQNVGDATVYNYDENYDVVDSTYHAKGDIYNTFQGLEPRFAMNYRINNFWAVKASFVRTLQYIQQASNSTAGSPLDLWFSASPNVKPQFANQYSVGVFRNLFNNQLELSLETYYKDMFNTIDFADHADLLLNKYLEGEIRSGKSKAYGVEFMAQKNQGRFTGWVSYTYSRAKRTIEGINNGNTYVAPYDKPHEFNTVLTYELTPRLSVSANWLFASGQPVTMPTQRYQVGQTIIPLYSERNGERYDPYHRLDLSVTLRNKEKEQRKWDGEWVFSVYNAYNRHNTWVVNFISDEANSNKLVAERTYLFPIIPSITYNFKF